jgi:hypothetical protein
MAARVLNVESWILVFWLKAKGLKAIFSKIIGASTL